MVDFNETVEVLENWSTVDIVEGASTVIEVVREGPQGPAGPATGIAEIETMVDVAIGDYFVLHPQSYTYSTDVPADSWTIVHPLDHRPNAVVTDTAGEEIDLEQSWPSPNVLQLDSNQTLPGIRATLT